MKLVTHSLLLSLFPFRLRQRSGFSEPDATSDSHTSSSSINKDQPLPPQQRQFMWVKKGKPMLLRAWTSTTTP